MINRPKRQGVTLLEAIVVVGMFSLVIVVVMVALGKSMDAWRRSSSQHTVEQALFRAQNTLSRDLQAADFEQLSTSPGPASLGIPDGDAIWFLSAIDPTTGEVVINDGTDSNDMGTLRWQRNILYYCVVPANHASHFGYSCTGGAGPGGYDDQCPHKMLVRQVIDGPDDPEGVELLLPDVTSYLDAPDLFDVSPISGPGLEKAKIVSGNLLTFKVNAADPEIQIDLQAASIPVLEKTVGVGTTSLTDNANTTQRLFAVFPSN